MKLNKAVLLCASLFLIANSNLLPAQQRSPGVASSGPRDESLRELERALNVKGRSTASSTAIGAWWMDSVLVSRIGLTNDQKLRIEKIFDSHRQALTSSMTELERNELLLKTLLESERLDRSAINAQVNRVIQTRSDVERANANMTLEMREQLSRAQWMQLQAERAYVEYLGAAGRRGRSTIPPEERK